MSFLDFIKNRQSQQQAPASQSQPETAKQMYTREVSEQKPTAQAIGSLSAADKVSISKAQDLFRKGTQAVQPSPASATPAPTDGATAPQPMAQMSMQQDKAAPALSPTTAQQGARAHEHETASTPQQGKSQVREQPTMARRPPSWER